MPDAYDTPCDRYETPFDVSRGSVADLDARLDPVGVQWERVDAITDPMQARLDRIEATLDRMDIRLDTMITTRQVRFWGMVLTLEITVWMLIVACWR
jgi:hypothetical protein